jgi:putative hydrolase of the HAD superfamily
MQFDQIELVLFDLGGVLVELGEEIFPTSWHPDEQSFGLTDWLSSEAAGKFETGSMAPSEFICQLKQTLSIAASNSEVQTAFEAWPRGLAPGAEALIVRLKSKYQVAVLSNSNEIHEPVLLRQFGLDNLINDIFFSHRIGHAKPSRLSFDYVLENLNFTPNQVLFFDDNTANINAAKALGMHAYQVFSPSDVNKVI